MTRPAPAIDPLAPMAGADGTAPGVLRVDDPEVQRLGDDVTVRWAVPAVELTFTCFRENGEGVHAELAVKHADAEVHWGRLNLASTTGREQLVKKLADVEKAVPWRPLLERACRLTATAVRRGAPTILLRPRPAPGAPFLIAPILPLGETAILFGDGGAGKGFVALALALAATNAGTLPGGMRADRGVPVLYCDWESVPEEIEERLYLLSRGLGWRAEGIHYRSMSRAFADEAPAIRAEVSRLGVEFVIVDSLAPAAGPEPEGADAATRTMNALRSLGPVTRLVIAHMTHVSAQQRAGGARPFGSVFNWNLARSVWELRKSEDTEDLVVGLYHRKVNRGRLHPPIGFRFTFGEEATSIRSADFGDAPDLLARASLPQRIKATLTAGAMTSVQLAEAVEATEDHVGRVLRRLRDKGAVVQVGQSRPGLWGLAVR